MRAELLLTHQAQVRNAAPGLLSWALQLCTTRLMTALLRFLHSLISAAIAITLHDTKLGMRELLGSCWDCFSQFKLSAINGEATTPTHAINCSLAASLQHKLKTYLKTKTKTN